LIADAFLDELYDEFNRLKENPFLFEEKYKSTRVTYLKRFHYGIHFQVVLSSVEILAILHTSRKPVKCFMK